MFKGFKKISWRFIRNTVLLSLLGAFLFVGGVAGAVSWHEYCEYYGDMLELKAVYDKANATPVTTMNGISLSLAEGVEFFDNGKAKPTAKDFVVTGHYSVDDRDYEETLEGCEVVIPADFSAHGGTVTASYLYKETKTYEEKTEIVTENGTEVVTTPVEKEFERLFTASLDVGLTEVRPARLVLRNDPYLVCYKENETFAKEGMVAVVEYNDGSVYEDVELEDIVVGNTSPLTLSDTSVELSYTLEGVRVTGEVSIVVLPAAEFSNGELIDIFADGGVIVEEGQQLSTRKAAVRARYVSGNVIAVDDYACTFIGHDETEIAKVGVNYEAEITANSVKKKFPVSVVKNFEAESTELNHCSSAEKGGKTVVQGFADGSTLSFQVTAEAGAYIDLYADMSNGYVVKSGDRYYAKEIAVRDFLMLYVNDKLYALGDAKLPVAGPYESKEETLSVLRTVWLGKVFVKKGENTVKIAFKENNGGVKDCDEAEPFGYIDSINVTAVGLQAMNSFADYLDYVKAENAAFDLKMSMSRPWATFSGTTRLSITGGTTDGTYAYYVVTGGDTVALESGSEYKLSASIYKYNVAENSVVGYSDQFFIYTTSQWGHYTDVAMFYKSGYVYTLNEERKLVRIATSDLDKNGGTGVELATDIPFTEAQLISSYDFEFCTPLQRFVTVGTDGFVHIYDAKLNELKYFAAKNGFKLGADDRYIYLIGGSKWDNTNLSVPLSIYDWSGDLVQSRDLALAGVAELTGGNASARSISAIGNSLYLTARGWSKPWGSAIFKLDFNYNTDEQTEKLSFGEYLEACTEKGVSPKYNIQEVTSGAVRGVPQYTHGFCTDGRYIYVSAGSGYDAGVYKIDPSNNYTMVGKSVTYKRLDTWNNADYIFWKDGYVYVVQYNEERTVVRVRCDDLDSSGTAPFEQVEGFTGTEKLPHSATYEPTRNKFAVVMTSEKNKVSIFNGKMQYEKDVTIAKGATVLGVASDVNHIYVTYETNKSGHAAAGVLVCTWDGKDVGDHVIEFTGFGSGGTNVQGMFVQDGAIYFAVVNWGSNGLHIVRVDLDYSVLS